MTSTEHTNSHNPRVSIIVPTFNEEENIETLLRELIDQVEICHDGGPAWEILLINDASTDKTAALAAKFEQVTVLSHPYNIGNGAAVKTGIRAANGDIILLLDGDGQHNPSAIPTLLAELDTHDMAVAARTKGTDANSLRQMLNGILNKLAGYILNHPVPDLTSGYRAIKADLAREYIYMLPNTFSYPTTLTMALMGSGYSVAFCTLPFRQRKGTSKINLFRDGVRFLMIAAKITTLVNPMKIFLPVSVACEVMGVMYYFYTFITAHRFTNFSLLLMTTGVLVFMLGLIAGQISLLGFNKRHPE